MYRLRAVLTAGLLWASAESSVAADPESALTLGAAINRALDRSPVLAGAREAIAAADARIEQAGFAPAIEVGLEFENFAGSGDLRGTDSLETTLQLSRAVELGDKRQRRIDAAQAGRDSAFAGLDVTRLEVATATARRFVDTLAAQLQLQAAGRFLDLAGTIRAQAERRVTAGSALSAELYRAQAEVGRQELFVTRAQAEREIASRALAASWGEPEAEPPAVTGDLFAIAALEPLESLLAKLDRSPRTTRLLTAQRVLEAERRLAQAQARPDVELSLGARHLNEPGDLGLVAGFSVPWGSRTRSRALVAERDALIRQAAADQVSARLDAVATIGGLYRQLDVRRKALTVLQRDILPATAAALQQIDRGYRLGRLSYGELALAAREALDAELERVRIATEYHQLLVELEGLTGTAIAPVAYP
jgi:cobalt-zinc-cadmium efflux system outer membrane protein